MWAAGLQAGTVSTYRPLALTTFVIDHMVFGPGPVGYHLTNIVLHSIGCLLCLFLLARWIPWRWATAATALFALHPCNLEVVVWINGRSELFVVIGIVGAILVSMSKSRAWQATAMPLMLVAMFGKETGLLLAPVALLFAGLESDDDRRWRFRPVAQSAIIVAVVVYLAVRAMAINGAGFETSSLGEVVVVIPAVIMRSMQGLLVPLEQTTTTIGVWLATVSTVEHAAYVVLTVTLIGLGILLLLRRRWVAAFGLLWWGLSLAPAAFLALTDWPGLYRWLYAGLPGLLLAIATASTNARFRSKLGWGILGSVPICALLLQLGIPTYQNDLTYFHQAAIEDPENPFMFNALGSAFLSANDPAAAELAFREALELGSNHTWTPWLLATAIARQGRCVEAEQVVASAAPDSAVDALSYTAMGVCYARQGLMERAREMYIRCRAQRDDCRQALQELEARQSP